MMGGIISNFRLLIADHQQRRVVANHTYQENKNPEQTLKAEMDWTPLGRCRIGRPNTM